MACNIQNEVVKAQRDIFKTIKESSKFKKAEAKLNDILANGINLEELKKEQKVNGKKNLVTRTTRGSKTDTVDLPLNFIDVKEVKVKKEGTNFFYRLQTNKFDVTVEDEVDVVITDKFYKEIKVTYTIEDTSKKQDLQTDITELQKIADGIKSGDSTAALKFFEQKAKEVTDAFDGVYGGIHQIIEKVRSDANIPVPPADAVVLVDKVKKHTGSNVINLDDPVSITKVKARKANTNFFFNVTQYKFLKESSSIIATNSYEEYIVEYRGKGSNTSNNTTNELPSKDSIASDVQQAFDGLSTNVGNALAAVSNVAGQFGKDISGLVSAASSGSLIQDALAQAQNQPATYTVEKTVRGKNTNAIVLESLAGGESGVLEVFTRREDQSFFSQMQKGNISGWRLEGEELYIFEPRAEIKCKYTQEIDPPASSGVPALSNDEDIPKLDPCKDIPALSVKIQEEIRKDTQTGQTEVITVKVKESKPPTRKTPTIKAEPAVNVAESPTIVNAQESPSTSLIQTTITPGEALKIYNRYDDFERANSIEYWQKRVDDYSKNVKEAIKSPLFNSLKSKKEASGIKSYKAYLATNPPEVTQEEIDNREKVILNAVGVRSVKKLYGWWKALLVASKFEIAGKFTTDEYENYWLDGFINYEGVFVDKSGFEFRRILTTPEDIAQFQAIRDFHLSMSEDIKKAHPYFHPNG
tara:strand:+ start:5223 stop:7310 length:2088 start_codon:yes stop_codon:yes gene_type:complete